MRYEERLKEMRREEPDHSEMVPGEEFRTASYQGTEQRLSNGCVAAFGLLVIVLVLALILAGAKIMIGEPSGTDATSNRSGSPDVQEAPRDLRFDTTRAVTLCDLNMRAQTARPNNYRSDWTWRTVERGRIVAIRRNFSAVNVMGVPIQGEYTCLVGKDTGQLVGLQFSDGGQMVTVPGRELGQR
jgi:hypothetical protein